MATSLAQYGMTWTFDGDYTTGQFVNGDYWVIGPVTVNSVSPAQYDLEGDTLNGSMIDPEIGVQSYDERTYMWDAGEGVSYPVTIQAGSSLISSISDTAVDRNPNMPLLTAAILTVVTSSPSATAFRPSYALGLTRTIYDYADVNTSLLSSLPKISGFPDAADITEWERKFERPWLLHGDGWQYGRIIPSENGHWYHQDQIQALSGAACMLLIDWTDKETLLIRYLQLALDYYIIQLEGVGGPYYWEFPTIFAGIMFDNEDMKRMFLDETYNSGSPYYSTHSYFFDDPRLNRTEWSEILPTGETWTYYGQRTGKEAVFYCEPDIGGGNATQHEHLEPTEWDWIETAGYPGGGAKQEGYRRQHSAGMTGCTLAALVLHAEDYFSSEAFIPYTDRWMSETTQMMEDYGAPVGDPDIGSWGVQTSNTQFVDDMWFEYRADYGVKYFAFTI